MSDLLSASSLYLAVLGLLYSVWYAEIVSAIDVKVPTFKEDRTAISNQVRKALRTKALPLTLGAVVLSLILMPDAVRIITDSVELLGENALGSIKFYDAVKTLYVAITLFTLTLTVHVVSLANRLRKRQKEIQH